MNRNHFASAEPLLTNRDIQDLIRLPKAISAKTPVRGYREEQGSRRCDLDLAPLSDFGWVFPVFIRQNIKFIENFSIGLRYTADQSKATTMTLVRYNGPHGESSRTADGHYAKPHIHLLTEDEIAKGHTQPQERHRKITDQYSTLEEALRVFFRDTATENYKEYFPELLQPRLFGEP